MHAKVKFTNDGIYYGLTCFICDGPLDRNSQAVALPSAVSNLRDVLLVHNKQECMKVLEGDAPLDEWRMENIEGFLHYATHNLNVAESIRKVFDA